MVDRHAVRQSAPSIMLQPLTSGLSGPTLDHARRRRPPLHHRAGRRHPHLGRHAVAGDAVPHHLADLAGGEQGLLSVAFHPQYTQNGFFYVYYTKRKRSPGNVVIARYRVSANDPNTRRPGQRRDPAHHSAPRRQPQRRPAAVRARRLPLRRHRRRRRRLRSAPDSGQRDNAARQDAAPRRRPERQHAAVPRHPAHQPVRRPRRRRATRSGPRACATRGASPSTA